MTKPAILTFVRYYLPGYKSGGPVWIIVNMVEHLGDKLGSCIVTADVTLWIPSLTQMLLWIHGTRGAKMFYASPKNRSVWSLARLMRKTPHDFVYLNSFSIQFLPFSRKAGLISSTWKIISYLDEQQTWQRLDEAHFRRRDKPLPANLGQGQKDCVHPQTDQGKEDNGQICLDLKAYEYEAMATSIEEVWHWYNKRW